MINSGIIKKVEKGKLSERIGRKVMGLKHCHCESIESKRSNLIQCYDCQTTDFLNVFLIINMNDW